jgi:pimeloyl-ACP methyl ester carboxylesterase
VTAGLEPLVLDRSWLPAPDHEREPEGFVVDVAATRIHFLDWGGGRGGAEARAGVLLIHGLGQTAWTWAPVARRLARVARVVAMDLRGHGLSDAPTEGYEPAQLAEDAIAVVEGSNLDLDGVVIAGHGFGAIVAAWAAGALEAEGSGRARGLVLVDGGWEDIAASSGMAPEEWLPGLEEPPEVMRSMAAYLDDRRGFDPATFDPDQDRAARATVVQVPAGHVVPATRPHALAASVRAMFDYRPELVLPEIGLPIVALLSDDPEGERFAALAAVAARRVGAGHDPIGVARFPGAGHNLMRYEPEAVTAAVLEVAGTIAR